MVVGRGHLSGGQLVDIIMAGLVWGESKWEEEEGISTSTWFGSNEVVAAEVCISMWRVEARVVNIDMSKNFVAQLECDL